MHVGLPCQGPRNVHTRGARQAFRQRGGGLVSHHHRRFDQGRSRFQLDFPDHRQPHRHHLSIRRGNASQILVLCDWQLQASTRRLQGPPPPAHRGSQISRGRTEQRLPPAVSHDVQQLPQDLRVLLQGGPGGSPVYGHHGGRGLVPSILSVPRTEVLPLSLFPHSHNRRLEEQSPSSHKQSTRVVYIAPFFNFSAYCILQVMLWKIANNHVHPGV